MTIRTCTKVNIGLNVLRKRPDGYHDLETLFVPYWGLGDVLTVEPAEELSIVIERDGGVDWDPMDDLTVRAWRLLKADFPSLPAVSIRLQKGAPVGAGLGGGSADAAFMLRALNELGGLGLSDSELAEYGARLGSDCPFFVGMTPPKNEPTIPLHPQGTGGVPPETAVASAPAVRPCRADYYPPASGHPQGTGGVPPETPCAGYGAACIRPMFATGRGEILEPFDIDLSGYELRVELPLDAATGRPVAVSTREAYAGIVPRETLSLQAGPALGKEGENGRIFAENPSEPGENNSFGRVFAENPSEQGKYSSIGRDLAKKSSAMSGNPSELREALKLPVEQWRGLVVNDFEATVCPRHPEIQELIDDFYRRGAAYAAMSGSGSAVFGLTRRST